MVCYDWLSWKNVCDKNKRIGLWKDDNGSVCDGKSCGQCLGTANKSRKGKSKRVMKGRSRQCPNSIRTGWFRLALGLAGAVVIGLSVWYWGRAAGLRRRIGQADSSEIYQEPQENLIDPKGASQGIWIDSGKSSKEPEEAEQEEVQKYQDFLRRMDGAATRRQIEENGFTVMEDHVFPLEMAGEGEVFLVPAIDRECQRLVLFFADSEQNILFRTERLMANCQVPGRLRQGNRGVAAVAFPDIDRDGLDDVVLITVSNGSEDGIGAMYKVGDVLFQGECGFYRDWRLSDKINRFGMNKSVRLAMSFAMDGEPAELLYEAVTMTQLKDRGFVVDERYSYRKDFEKLGELLVVPGFYKLAEYYIFMIYLVNEQGKIVWSAQPMGEYENLYGIVGIDTQDIDGDGLKDLVALAKYTYDTPEGQRITEKDYTIYYQRTGGFLMDTEFKSRYQCGEETAMEDIVELARSYWGWGAGND